MDKILELLKSFEAELRITETVSLEKLQEFSDTAGAYLGKLKSIRIEAEAVKAFLVGQVEKLQAEVSELKKNKITLTNDCAAILKNVKESEATHQKDIDEKTQLSLELDVKITKLEKIISTLNQERDIASEDAAKQQTYLSETEKAVKTATNEKNVLESRRDKIMNEIGTLTEERDNLNKDIGKKREDVVILEKRAKELKK